MKSGLITSLLICAGALVGCASPLPVVEREAAPKAEVAYVAGLFSGSGQGFGLGLTHAASGGQYLVPFFKYGSYYDAMALFLMPEHKEALNMVEVPPGTYKITHWAAYNPAGNEEFVNKKIDLKGASTTFEAKAGRVIFIGRYKATQGGDVYKKILYRIDPMWATEEDFLSALKTTYPGFGGERADVWAPAVWQQGTR